MLLILPVSNDIIQLACVCVFVCKQFEIISATVPCTCKKCVWDWTSSRCCCGDGVRCARLSVLVGGQTAGRSVGRLVHIFHIRTHIFVTPHVCVCVCVCVHKAIHYQMVLWDWVKASSTIAFYHGLQHCIFIISCNAIRFTSPPQPSPIHHHHRYYPSQLANLVCFVRYQFIKFTKKYCNFLWIFDYLQDMLCMKGTKKRLNFYPVFIYIFSWYGQLHIKYKMVFFFSPCKRVRSIFFLYFWPEGKFLQKKKIPAWSQTFEYARLYSYFFFFFVYIFLRLLLCRDFFSSIHILHGGKTTEPFKWNFSRIT